MFVELIHIAQMQLQGVIAFLRTPSAESFELQVSSHAIEVTTQITFPYLFICLPGKIGLKPSHGQNLAFVVLMALAILMSNEGVGALAMLVLV